MKYAFSPLAFALGSGALVVRQSQQCVQLQASGGATGTLGQLSDGQNRIGGNLPSTCYCLSNGGFTDSSGRGCILTSPTTQFQCDSGATSTTGFTISSTGSVTYNGNTQFYACPANDNNEYNVYTQPVSGQSKCVEITLSTGGSCGASSSGKASSSAPAPSQPASSKPVASPSPSQPASSQPAPPQQPSSRPAPSMPAPSQPAPSQPTPPQKPSSYPVGSKPAPSKPVPSQPAPSQPAPPQYPSSKPIESQPVPSQPSQPAPPQQPSSKPMKSQPVPSKPAPSQPAPPQQPSSKPAPSKPAPSPPMPSSKPFESQPAPSQPAPPQQPSSKPVESQPAPSPPAASSPAASPSKPAASPSKPVASSPAAPSNSACPADINGNYQYPHLIVPVSSSSPSTPQGTSYFGAANSTTCSIFNFDIPQSYSGQTCSLIFLLPEQSQLQTSSYTLSGSGSLTFSKSATPASQSTTWENKPAGNSVGSLSVSPGNSYTVVSGMCAAGTTVTYQMCATGSLALRYFQDYNPSPLGLYIRQC